MLISSSIILSLKLELSSCVYFTDEDIVENQPNFVSFHDMCQSSRNTIILFTHLFSDKNILNDYLEVSLIIELN